MTEVLRIHVDGMPQTKGSWRAITGRGGRTRLIPDNEHEEAWALTIAWAVKAKLRGIGPTLDRFAVELLFELLPRKGRKSNKRDLDKLMRSVLDALTGIVWIDDEQVDSARLRKQIGNAPGVTIVVERIAP